MIITLPSEVACTERLVLSKSGFLKIVGAMERQIADLMKIGGVRAGVILFSFLEYEFSSLFIV